MPSPPLSPEATGQSTTNAAATASPPVATPDDDTGDSALGDDDDDDGSNLNYGSVSSSIYNFRVENGRTYHAYSDGKSSLPNDEREQDRMDLVYHAILRMFDGKAFFAPAENIQRIVDMGTGTGKAYGHWTSATSIQKRTSLAVQFRIDDLEHPWVFEKPIDLVHSRLCSGNAIRSWPDYLAESFRCLRPGGWVEAQEFDLAPQSDDDSFPADSAIIRWHNLFHEGMLRAGCEMRCSSAKLKEEMEKAGFVNVQSVDMMVPIY
ncbi:hypothetical protein ONS95_011635 [Cadophora gregata]|uniref:uncharacterized protein n=1 Tax=Cadophora gregata TaxID=51156 RepID=UPI0026DD29CC|nr:uncharacterized protein ONS95_011635 [Cadophora gregata]KAK0120229.1 hypothetical protein ONS95_011635 [Cadophora gregata]